MRETRRPRIAVALAALATALLLLRGGGAAAAPPADPPVLTPEQRERVTELTREAQELRREGDFAAAARKLEEAIGLHPAPVLFYNLGRVREDQGQLESAAAAYERCLAERPAKDLRPLAQKALKGVRARLAHGTLTLEGVPEGATVLVDGVRRGSGPPGPLQLDPGVHRVEVRQEGFQPFAESVRLAGGGTVALKVTLRALAVVEPPAEPPVEPPPVEPEPTVTTPEPEPEPEGGERHRLFRLGLTVSEGALLFEGEAFRGKVGLELTPSLDFRWFKVDVAAAVVVEPPVAFLLRPGVRFGISVFYVRPALQFLLTPITTTGMLFGVGAEIPVGAGWSVIAEFDVSVWFAALNVVPLDGRLGVSYGF